MADEAPNAQNLGLPAFYEVEADPSWRTIDFISDLHLRADDPDTWRAWVSYMRQTRADAIFILGDLFEVWVGDDAASRPGFEAECVDVLETAGARVQLAFMAGNRDFLLGTSMLRRCGMMGLADPTRLVAWGQAVLLTHGDMLCTADTDYQTFRQQVRENNWQSQFLRQPLEVRRQQAAVMRDASVAHQREKVQQGGQDALSEINVAMAVAWMHQAGCRSMVHGHTHRPGTEVMAPGYTRHVLSDWDMRATRPRAEVLRLTRDGFARLHAVRA